MNQNRKHVKWETLAWCMAFVALVALVAMFMWRAKYLEVVRPVADMRVACEIEESNRAALIELGDTLLQERLQREINEAAMRAGEDARRRELPDDQVSDAIFAAIEGAYAEQVRRGERKERRR